MMRLPDGRKKNKDMFNRLDTIPACDRHPAVSQPASHVAVASTALRYASRG